MQPTRNTLSKDIGETFFPREVPRKLYSRPPSSSVAADHPGHLRYPRRRLPSLVDAEDALQDATLEFIQHADALATIEKPNAWIGVLLRQTMIDRYRPAATQSHESSEPGDHETLAAAERVKATCRVSNPNTARCCSRS